MPGLAVEKGDIEPIAVAIGQTGQTVTIKIYRNSDKFFLDWSDNTFKTAGSLVTPSVTLTEVDPVNASGVYALMAAPHSTGLNTGLLTNLTTTLLEELVVVASWSGPRIDPGRMKIVPRIDGVRPEREVLSRINAMARGKITLTGEVPQPLQTSTYYKEDGVTVSHTNDNTGNERNPQ